MANSKQRAKLRIAIAGVFGCCVVLLCLIDNNSTELMLVVCDGAPLRIADSVALRHVLNTVRAKEGERRSDERLPGRRLLAAAAQQPNGAPQA